MLPLPLRLNKKQREHEQLVEFANHLQATVSRTGFLGDNLRPSLETLTALAEGMQKFDKDYQGDHFLPEEPKVKSLSSWKNERMQETA